MAVPKKKVSKTQTRKRHSTWQTRKINKIINKLTIVKCPNCWNLKLSHYVCPTCWYYKWKQVISIKSKSKNKEYEV